MIKDIVNAIANDDIVAFNELNIDDYSMVLNGNGDTILHVAVRTRAIDIIMNLVSKGIPINVVNNRGETPLFESVRVGDSIVTELLIHNNAVINHLNNIGESPFLRAVVKGNKLIVDLLLENGADYNLANELYQNALFYAVESGSVELFRILVQHDLNIHAADARGNNLFHLIALKGDVEMLEALLGETNNCYLWNNNLETPLHVAVKSNANLDVIEVLILNGCLIETEDMDGLTAYHYAEILKRTDVIRLFDFYLSSVEYHGNFKEQRLVNFVKNRQYKALEHNLNVGEFDIHERDKFNLSLNDYNVFINDEVLRKILKK